MHLHRSGSVGWALQVRVLEQIGRGVQRRGLCDVYGAREPCWLSPRGASWLCQKDRVCI